ncbi:MAG: hypothetical protein AB7H90_01390 [Alphaproteobacteria bacterium]
MNITQQTLQMGRYSPPTWEAADDEFRKVMLEALSQKDVGLAKAASTRMGMLIGQDEQIQTLLDGGASEALANAIAKTITTATGLVAYDLQAPAKNLYPVKTPLRNRIPRRGGGVGLATNWRQITALIGSGWDAEGWVPEGQRSAQMSYQAVDKSANFVTIGEEDAATYEAINAGRGFEDVMGRMTFRLLQKMMLKEEMAILGGNRSLALGVPATPVLAAGGTGATLPAATYSVIVVALTLEGYKNSTLASGVATTKTITGADGKTYTLNGGASNKSAAATQAITLGEHLSATVIPIRGAVAYAWFIGAAGSEKLEAITTINSVRISAPLAGTGQAATAVTTDYSRNATMAFDGLMTTAFAAGSNAYVKTMATGTAGTGTPLTASGRGSVTEIDDMFQTMYDTYRLSPSLLLISSRESRSITNHVFTGNSNASLLSINSDGGRMSVTAGGAVDQYFNSFTGQVIPIIIHDDLPPGTIVGWAENLPVQYQSNEVPNVAEILTRADYYEINWPLTTRQRQVGVYAEEVLAVYSPFAMGVITNIGA